MEITPQDLNERLNDFKEKLGQVGIKLTHQRLEIFREVATSDSHPDAETIFNKVRERMPTVSLDTVYRTLWLLLDLGLITTLGMSRERTRFDGNMQPHHHFVCVKCGATSDFYSKDFDNLKIPDTVKNFGTVEKTHVEIRGVCKRCASKNGED